MKLKSISFICVLFLGGCASEIEIDKRIVEYNYELCSLLDDVSIKNTKQLKAEYSNLIDLYYECLFKNNVKNKKLINL